MKAGAATRAITAVLRHPLVMRCKRVVRDVHWRVSSSRIEQPALPPNVRSVLFVCLGNICRSPFAGRLAENRYPNLAITFGSAGIKASQSDRSPERACEAATAFGVSLQSHRPVAINRSLVDASDLIVAMEASQVEQLRTTYPDAANRITLLALFDDQARGYDRHCIEDPFMRPLSEFVHCFHRIDRAVSGLLTRLGVVSMASVEHANLVRRERIS